MSTQTQSIPISSNLFDKLRAAQAQSKQEEHAALKKKLHITIASRKSGWQDTSGNEAVMLAARRSLIREHIAKGAIMKKLGMESLPFATVWRDYLERNAVKSSPVKHETCTTSNCGCDTKGH